MSKPLPHSIKGATLRKSPASAKALRKTVHSTSREICSSGAVKDLIPQPAVELHRHYQDLPLKQSEEVVEAVAGLIVGFLKGRDRSLVSLKTRKIRRRSRIVISTRKKVSKNR